MLSEPLPSPFDELKVDHRAPVSVYKQLMDGIEDLLYRGRLKAGDRLPPVRALAKMLDINPNTVARSYRELESSGVLTSRVGRGTFLNPARTDAASKDAKLKKFWSEMKERCLKMGISETDLVAYMRKRK